MRNLRSTEVVHYRVRFLAAFLEMEFVEKSLPPGNEIVKLHVGDGRRCGADILDGDPEESWVPRWGRHLNHVGVSLHHQLRTIRRDFGVDVPAETGYSRRCAYPSNKLGRLHGTHSKIQRRAAKKLDRLGCQKDGEKGVATSWHSDYPAVASQQNVTASSSPASQLPGAGRSGWRFAHGRKGCGRLLLPCTKSGWQRRVIQPTPRP